MKNKTSILLIALLALSGLMVLATMPATTQANGDHTIYISAVDGQNKYNDTSIPLEPNTEYTIVFVNPDDLNGHNLRIDVNQNIESGGDVADSEDILIGDANDGSGIGGPWNGTWTTPASGEYTFYCGFPGHYLTGGMEGTFIVGEGADDGDSPGFGAFAGIAALLVVALAIPQIRKR